MHERGELQVSTTATSEENGASPRLRAAFQLARHLAVKSGGDLRDHLASYLGSTGGDHILREKSGRTWAVDLVTGHCVQCAGLMPSQWKHPPQVAA